MRRFTPADLPEVNAWQVARGMPELELDALSHIGLIVPGVAAAWLYRTDSSVALLENYIANPASEAKTRDDALDAITCGLVAIAQATGFKHVVGITQHPRIEARAAKWGFLSLGTYHLIHKDI